MHVKKCKYKSLPDKIYVFDLKPCLKRVPEAANAEAVAALEAVIHSKVQSHVPIKCYQKQ